MRLPLRLSRHLRDFILRRPLPTAGPFRLWVDITSRCNLSCPACPQRLLPPEERHDLDPEILQKLVAQSRGWIREVNLFHRGEPLLHPNLPWWIRSFKEAGVMVRLHTNASKLDPGRVAGLLWAQPDMITCSLDTLEPAAYARARPGASLEKILNGLARLLRARRRLGLVLPHITLLTMGEKSIDPASRRSLANLQTLGLDRTVHRLPHNWGGSIGPARAKKRPAVCTFPWYGLAVLSDGRVSPCPQDFFGRIVLGDASKQSLAQIWHGSRAKALRRAHARHDLTDYPVCQSCDRIHRPTILGLPREHLKNFFWESIVKSPQAPDDSGGLSNNKAVFRL